MNFDVITATRRRLRRLTWSVIGAAGAFAIVVLLVLATGHSAATTSPPPAPVAITVHPGAPSPTLTRRPEPLLPPGMRWDRIGGVDLPVSAATGPADLSGGRARGFAHTPAGAVVAAAHLVARTTAELGPAVFEPTIREQVVGPDAAAMATVVADTYTQTCAQQGIPYGQPLGNLPAALVAARIDHYTPTTAALELLTSAVDGTGVIRYATTTLTMSYVDQDWRLVAPSDGRWDSQVTIVDPTTLTGFRPLTAG
jgi:hypothetical protein